MQMSFLRLGHVLDINKDPPHSGGYFSFGHSPNNTSGAQVRIKRLPACAHYLLPVNGSRGSNILNWSASLSLFSWSAMYSVISFHVFPYRIHIISFAPKLPIPVCKFHITILLEYH